MELTLERNHAATEQLIDDLSLIVGDYDKLMLLPNLPVPSTRMPKRALSRRSTFRRDNFGPGSSRMSTRLSRYSIDYSEYIFDEYGKPSPVAESFFDGETSPILRSISQRSENHLRRTRSSETIIPLAVALLTRTDTIGSTPRNRLNRWLLKQEEYFHPQRKAAPVSNLPSLPAPPTIRRARSAEFHRETEASVESQVARADTSGQKDKKKNKKAHAADDSLSCVGIPYAAMLTPKRQKDVNPSDPSPPGSSSGAPHLGIDASLRAPSPVSRTPSPGPRAPIPTSATTCGASVTGGRDCAIAVWPTLGTRFRGNR
jgi:hypothetical protein